MSSTTKPPIFRRRRVAQFRRCGEIYNWLRAHHAAVRQRIERGDMTLAALCEEMARHGVTTRGGEAPNVKAVSKAWQKVCRDLEEIGEATAAKPRSARSKMPSRIPKDWRPQEITRTANPPISASASGGAKEPYDPQKALAHLKRIMNERSGRYGQS